MEVNFSRPLRKNLWFWGVLSLIGILVVFAVMFVAAIPWSSDTLRHRMIRTLSEKLDSDVELGDLTLHVFPALRADGANLIIRKHGRTDVPPLITIKSFHVDANLIGLWHKHARHVQLDGLDIQIPPHGDDDARKDDKKSQEKSTKGSKHDDDMGKGVIIDRLDSNDARVIIIPKEANRDPKVWALHHLVMHGVGVDEAMPFEATLTNGVPPGEIEVKGSFGPWGRDEPGDTPLEGTFTFTKADLGVFKGIGGTLSSQGYFGGTLSVLDVNGETDTPNFVITVGGHPFPLHTKYHALVDGTNGDTRLERIDGWFLNSYLLAKGAVLGAPKGHHGRTVTLDIVMDKARIEDIMKMAVKTPTPPMTGDLKLTTKFLLPPGEKDVVDRLRLDGQFAIAQVKFTNYDVQGKIEELSKRASAKTAEPGKERVVSDFQGKFKLADGQLVLPSLSFAVPGAKVELAGVYALKAETLDFKGQLLLDAKISQTVTGFKSVLLKVVDPLFKQKDGTGSVIPIKIGGTRSAPDFGLDVKRVFKKSP